MTPKAAATIASNSRLTIDEARALVALAIKKGWMSKRPDAHVLQFKPGSGYAKVHRPAHR